MTPASIALNRFGFGPATAGEAARALADPQGYLRRQMDAFDPAPRAIADRLAARRSTTAEIVALTRRLRQDARSIALAGPDGAGGGAMAEGMTAMAGAAAREDARAAALAALPRRDRDKVLAARTTLRDDIALRVDLAVNSPAPLIERLVHFWANHFSVAVGKPGTDLEVGRHEFTAIRPHVLGRFGDMLEAAVLHAAMLLYLDQHLSVGPNAPLVRPRGRPVSDKAGARGLNENLAREVLELHTLGVNGGYTQTDVTEFARALTGWTVRGMGRVGRLAEGRTDGACFVALAHEPGARLVLGRSYPESGKDQARAILRDLASHPATARHIATKLARHFAGDTPPPALVARLEADFLATGGDLASLTRVLIAAPEAWAPGPVKFRAPFEWLVTALRITGAAPPPRQRIVTALTQLGQAPWRAPSPAGYDDVAPTWAGPDALVRRVDVAELIARDAPADDIPGRAEAAFPGALRETTRAQLARAETGQQALALLLVSPEMLRR